jgi:hypothetical protein
MTYSIVSIGIVSVVSPPTTSISNDVQSKSVIVEVIVATSLKACPDIGCGLDRHVYSEPAARGMTITSDPDMLPLGNVVALTTGREFTVMMTEPFALVALIALLTTHPNDTVRTSRAFVVTNVCAAAVRAAAVSQLPALVVYAR